MPLKALLFAMIGSRSFLYFTLQFTPYLYSEDSLANNSICFENRALADLLPPLILTTITAVEGYCALYYFQQCFVDAKTRIGDW